MCPGDGIADKRNGIGRSTPVKFVRYSLDFHEADSVNRNWKILSQEMFTRVSLFRNFRTRPVHLRKSDIGT